MVLHFTVCIILDCKYEAVELAVVSMF